MKVLKQNALSKSHAHRFLASHVLALEQLVILQSSIFLGKKQRAEWPIEHVSRCNKSKAKKKNKTKIKRNGRCGKSTDRNSDDGSDDEMYVTGAII